VEGTKLAEPRDFDLSEVEDFFDFGLEILIFRGEFSPQPVDLFETDHFHDRFKMLVLSHRQGDIFEELHFHITLVRGFVNLPEFSKLRPKIRDPKYC
jgi:hypothetical protein